MSDTVKVISVSDKGRRSKVAEMNTLGEAMEYAKSKISNKKNGSFELKRKGKVISEWTKEKSI